MQAADGEVERDFHGFSLVVTAHVISRDVNSLYSPQDTMECLLVTDEAPQWHQYTSIKHGRRLLLYLTAIYVGPIHNIDNINTSIAIVWTMGPPPSNASADPRKL